MKYSIEVVVPLLNKHTNRQLFIYLKYRSVGRSKSINSGIKLYKYNYLLFFPEKRRA